MGDELGTEVRKALDAEVTKGMAGRVWDEHKHPRGFGGKFGSGGGAKKPSKGGKGRGRGEVPVTGHKLGTTWAKDFWGDAVGGKPTTKPTKTDSVDEAIRLLADGKAVELTQPRQVSTLLDRLAKIVDEAKGKGEKAPTYNLCQVSVKGTNLFCTQSKGIPRIKMPQLSGVPTAGSKADKLDKNGKGEVDLGPAFRDHLAGRGISIEDTTEKASYLRASQNELNGAKVAGMARALEAGTLPQGRIFVSRDNYVIDGHHRWAANVGADVRDNKEGDVDMQVARVDMGIIAVLAAANNFATSMGIPPAGVGQMAPEIKKGMLGRLWDEHKHPRRGGKFAPKAGGGGMAHGPASGPDRASAARRAAIIAAHGDPRIAHAPATRSQSALAAAHPHLAGLKPGDTVTASWPGTPAVTGKVVAITANAVVIESEGKRRTVNPAHIRRPVRKEETMDVAKTAGRALPPLDRSPKKNWVEEAGGLPDYIDRIARHLHTEGGMTISHAIAAAIEQVKKWASGVGNVKPDTRAKAQKAVAQWEAMKVKARATKSAQRAPVWRVEDGPALVVDTSEGTMRLDATSVTKAIVRRMGPLTAQPRYTSDGLAEEVTYKDHRIVWAPNLGSFGDWVAKADIVFSDADEVEMPGDFDGEVWKATEPGLAFVVVGGEEPRVARDA